MSMLGFPFFLLGITTCHMSARRNDITPLQTSLTFFSYLVDYLCTCTRKTFNSLQGKFFFMEMVTWPNISSTFFLQSKDTYQYNKYLMVPPWMASKGECGWEYLKKTSLHQQRNHRNAQNVVRAKQLIMKSKIFW